MVVAEQRILDLILELGPTSSVTVEVGEEEEEAEAEAEEDDNDVVAAVSRSIALSISPHNLSELSETN